MSGRIAIVGAGFTGAVIAHQLANAGFKLCVFDLRSHVAGNCHTERDSDTGIMLHCYGPHIFHTSDRNVWDFVQQFDEFMPFTNRVKAITAGRVYSLPLNLLTINQFFGKSFTPTEAEAFIASRGDRTIEEPQTFEEQALRFIGKELYEAFFKNYTLKQWGLPPSRLPASILKRLPIRFNYDDNYYSSRFQGMPKNGYTHIVDKMLAHKNISLNLHSKIERNIVAEFDHVFYSGPIDEWFDFSFGRLGYRTLDFVSERHFGDYQGNAVLNYCDMSSPWTRISEHKHFSPWESHSETVIYKEYSRSCEPSDTPYYPIRLVDEQATFARYVELANLERNTTFVGRLGTYRYLDMHVAISEAIEIARLYCDARINKKTMPVFLNNPLSSN
jgi:UDP-galactopyranose mutase